MRAAGKGNDDWGRERARDLLGKRKEEGTRERARERARDHVGKRKAMRTAGEGKDEGGRERARKDSSAARREAGRSARRAAPAGAASMEECLTVGAVVELCSDEEAGYLGAWFQVRITELFEFEAAVDYCHFSATPGSKVPHKETALLTNLRPLPPKPLLECKSWEVLDAVETLDNHTWWQGYVQSFNPKTQTYRVCYEHGHPPLDLPAESIRTRLDWVPVSPTSSKRHWVRAARMQVKPKKLRIKPPTKSAFTPGAGSPPLPDSPEPRRATSEATSIPSSGGGASGSAGQDVEIITPFLHPLREASTYPTTQLGMGAYFQLLHSFRTRSPSTLTEARVRILEDIQTELGLPADQCAQAHCAVFGLPG